jgi:hypothetical protein
MADYKLQGYSDIGKWEEKSIIGDAYSPLDVGTVTTTGGTGVLNSAAVSIQAAQFQEDGVGVKPRVPHKLPSEDPLDDAIARAVDIMKKGD